MAEARVEYREEFELHDLGGYQAPKNIDVEETDLGVTNVHDHLYFVQDWDFKLFEENFRKNIEKFSDMRLRNNIKKSLKKNLIEYKSPSEIIQKFYIIVDKNI